MNKINFSERREAMVESHIAGRGVRSQLVLDAMRTVPREAFLPEHLREFAYEDAPLPIAEGQTISQPYIVALMTEALALEGGEEGAGDRHRLGLCRGRPVADRRNVYTVERIGQLAEKAAAVLADLGYANVHVLHADGTRGWADHAPYDAIVVAAGGPEVPESLKAQLKIGGRLVIPVGIDRRVQELLRVTRALGATNTRPRISPMSASSRWSARKAGRADGRVRQSPEHRLRRGGRAEHWPKAIAASCEHFEAIASADLEPLLRRIGDARVVLLGEATHGTSEFYRMRERISRELIERKGFSFIAIEGDWPDAARIDHYVRHAEYPPSEWTAFARFPDLDVAQSGGAGVRRLVAQRAMPLVEPGKRVAFHGLDLYSLYNSIRSVLNYLDDVDPQTARVARAALWLPDALAGRPCDLRSCGADGRLPDLRARSRRHAARTSCRSTGPTPSTMASGSWMPCRTRAWSPMPSATTGSCITARARPGICATATCSRR